MRTKFFHRSNQLELLDAPFVPKSLLVENLRELGLINRTLGGHSISVKGIKRLLTDRSKTYTIADIGCGGGDALKAMATWARKNGYRVQLVGVDINQDAIEYMLQECKNYPEINGIVSSYEAFLSSAVKPDVVHCSLFCHHLTDEELIQLFASIKKKVQLGFIINDLQRHWFAYYSIKTLTRMLKGSVLVQNDAPLSVLRGFKKKELQKIVQRAGIDNAEIKWKWAFRYLMLWNVSDQIK